MPGPSAVLFNHETNTYEEVPAEKISAALASGQYTASGASTQTAAEGGLVTRPMEQLGSAAIQGESGAGAAIATESAKARRDAQRAAVSDKALTFSEGIVDALSMGLVHGTSEMDELRREADSGTALLGQLVGTAIGLKLPGPLRGLAEGGEAAGSAVARALVGEAESGFRGAVTRGLAEAGANAAIMAAGAFGHQITDAVIADKPFTGEAIASEAGLGALMGFGFGFAGSAFGQLAKASRGAVEASGIAVNESRAAMDAVQGLTREWDATLEQHSQRLGVLKVLADEGHIPGNMIPERAAVLRQAERARDALRGIDAEVALSGDVKEFQKWRDAVDAYQESTDILTRKMTPSLRERFGEPVKPGKLEDLVKPPTVPIDIDGVMADKGFRTPMAEGLDKAMTPEARSAYETIYGRPYEDLPAVPGAGPSTGAENLGGKVTPTSEQGTNVGSARGRGRAPAEHAPALERREVVQAGEPAAGRGETGRDFADSTQRRLELPAGEEPTIAPPPKSTEGKQAVRSYLNDWVKEFDAKPRVTAADQLQAKLQSALDGIAQVGGSRLDSAGGMELTRSTGLKGATSPLGQRLDQVWSLAQVGKMAADEARGVKTPLRKGLSAQIGRYVVGKAGRAIGGAVIGGSLGGPAGAIMGMALTSAGFAGKAASTAGRLMQQIAVVGDALLSGRRATLAVKLAVGNRPYQYSDEGPLTDPVQRIQEVQRLAANPGLIRARITKQLGDLAVTSPELAQHMTETAVNQITAIAQSAPAIMMTPLGKTILPSGTAMNKFFDFENAMHNLPGILGAVASGDATSAQIKALQIGFPAVHSELMKQIVGGKEALERLNDAKLRTVEKVLGYPLTRATADPTVTARYQSNWEPPKPPPAPAQAFKITAPKPTPVQAASGERAPGNERIAR